jgi:hypothetical protein
LRLIASLVNDTMNRHLCKLNPSFSIKAFGENETLNAYPEIKDMDKRVGIQGYSTLLVPQRNIGMFKIVDDLAAFHLREGVWLLS